MAEENNIQSDTSAKKYLDQTGLETVFGIIKNNAIIVSNEISVDDIDDIWDSV